MRAKDRVLSLLINSKFALTANSIGDICHIGSWRLYPILAKLENDKRVTSYFGDSPEPRNRFYEWNSKTEAY